MQIPPPPPRPAPENYVWRILATDAWAVIAFVFLVLGAPFIVLGLALALVEVTWPIGFLFVALGLLFEVGAASVILWRCQSVKKIGEAMRTGEAAQGRIVQVEKLQHIRVGRRHPWKIDYQFSVDGQTYVGQVRTFAAPGPALQPGQQAAVLYLAQAPHWNVLYPYP